MSAYKRLALAGFLVPLLAVLGSCSKTSSDPKREVQAEFDSNPKLKERGIVVKVVEVYDGYVTAEIVSGLSPAAARALNRGSSLKEIYFFTDTSVGPLIEAENVLKEHDGVKAVMWTTKPPAPRARKR